MMRSLPSGRYGGGTASNRCIRCAAAAASPRLDTPTLAMMFDTFADPPQPPGDAVTVPGSQRRLRSPQQRDGRRVGLADALPGHGRGVPGSRDFLFCPPG